MPHPADPLLAAPRRAKPPRHLADLSPVERRAAVRDMGESPFRTQQIARHYFTRLVDDPAEMSDLPRASREVVARVLARGWIPGGPPRVSNAVFTGMGGPLANDVPVIAAIRRLTDSAPDGVGLSQRHITVSTVGLVPAIRRLAAEGLNVTLAVSLHAPDNDLHNTLVSLNTRWSVAEVFAWEYADKRKRRVSIEYALIRGVNDQPWRADLLGGLLRRRLAHVNLMPLSPTPGSAWTASRPADQREFARRLEACGVTVTVRDTRGRDIDGACGQLAAQEV